MKKSEWDCPWQEGERQYLEMYKLIIQESEILKL